MVTREALKGNQIVLRSSKQSIVIAIGEINKRNISQRWRHGGNARKCKCKIEVEEIFRKKSTEKENEMNCNQFQSAQPNRSRSMVADGPHWGNVISETIHATLTARVRAENSLHPASSSSLSLSHFLSPAFPTSARAW